MMLRPKSLRRLGIILIVIAAVTGVGIVLGYRVHRAKVAQIEADRKAGWSAYIAKDYAKALDPLDRFLKKRPNETKIALAFAESRFRVETNTNQHIRQAVETLDNVLKREPDNLAAKHLLLEIYPQTANTDALERLADTVLEAYPDDTRALLGRITVRIRQSRLDDALTASLQYAKLKPDDLEARIRVMQLMKALQKPQADIQQFADKQYTDNRMDPRHLLLQAFACNYRNDNEKALWFLQQAANQPLSDSDFVRLLANLFDQLKRYSESRTLLETVAERTGEPEILRILIARLWQNGQDEEIIERLARLDTDNPKTDAELLAMRVMAHYQLGNTAQAQTELKSLADRKDSRIAAAWAMALDARFESTNDAPVTVANKLSAALARDPENGIFRTWLADSYWNLGEAALALRQWQSAAIALPGWSKPYIGMSQALLVLGQASDAHEAAKAAVERVPNTASFVNLALIRYRLIEETGDLRNAEELLQLVRQIQQTIPGEPRTLPVFVALLARTGDRDAAKSCLQTVIASSAKYDDETLLKLVAVSRSEALQCEVGILNSTEGRSVSPHLALSRATMYADAGKSAEGLQWLKDQVAKSPGKDKLDWQIAIAQYLDSINHPSANEAWRTLGDQNEKVLTVQRDILNLGRNIRNDRDFIAKTIYRLRDLTGEDGQQWRLERARFLIEGPDIMKDGVEAALLLREIIGNAPRQIEPRMLLARTHELTGNVTGAIDHLRGAQAVDPRSATVALDLIRLLQQQGRTDEVRDVLKQLSNTAMMNARQRVMLASLMADAGDTDRAIKLLLPDETHGVLLPQGRLLLAELYRRNGESKAAKQIFVSLLESPSPSVSAIASAAEFYAVADNLPSANAAIARLKDATAEPVEKLIAQARFDERFGTEDAALKRFREAADTKTETGYLALIDYHLRRQDFAQAVQIARDAETKLPDSANIANRLLESQALAAQKTDPRNLKPLIDALSRDPSRVAEVEALKTLQEIRAGRIPKTDITARLRSVADKYPRFLPLQEQVIENYLAEKKVDDAVVLSRRTMAALPTDPGAAQLAVRTLRVARLWGEMKLAAEQWKLRSPTGTLEADTAIAEALLETAKPAEAITQLDPHRAMIDGDVRTQPQAAVVIARAMLAEGNGKSARTLLTPLLRDVSGRRMWMMIALGATRSHAEAITWLQTTSDATPAENKEEQLALATAWTTIARKYDDTKTLQQAADRLASYLQDRPRDGDALLLLGGVYLQLGNTESAESALRAILESKSDHPAACNDLACLLIGQNKSLDEAEKLARIATSKAPTIAAYQDTLARVLVARQQIDAAKTAFENALRLDPDLVAARIGYARVLKEKGETSAAAKELNRVDKQLLVNPRAGKPYESEIASLRELLSAPN